MLRPADRQVCDETTLGGLVFSQFPCQAVANALNTRDPFGNLRALVIDRLPFSNGLPRTFHGKRPAQLPKKKQLIMNVYNFSFAIERPPNEIIVARHVCGRLGI